MSEFASHSRPSLTLCRHSRQHILRRAPFPIYGASLGSAKGRRYSSYIATTGCTPSSQLFHSRKTSRGLYRDREPSPGNVSTEFQYLQGFPNQIPSGSPTTKLFGDKQLDAVGRLRNRVAPLCHNDERRQPVALIRSEHQVSNFRGRA